MNEVKDVFHNMTHMLNQLNLVTGDQMEVNHEYIHDKNLFRTTNIDFYLKDDSALLFFNAKLEIYYYTVILVQNQDLDSFEKEKLENYCNEKQTEIDGLIIRQESR